MIVVVGVDDSTRSAVAARKAGRMAVWLDAELHAVHVAHVPAAMLAVLAGVEAGTTEFTEAQRRAVWDIVDPVLERSGARVTRVDLEGHPADITSESSARNPGMGQNRIFRDWPGWMMVLSLSPFQRIRSSRSTLYLRAMLHRESPL